MNIAFFLIPKEDVVTLNVNSNMRQALERMEYHRYTAVPVIDDKGRYVGTLAEGDLLWKLKNTPELTFAKTSHVKITEINWRMTNAPVKIDAEIEDLLTLASAQNFVPVLDDNGIFIGIIRRSDLINYYAKEIFNKMECSI